ncbi:hypothetical protein GC174_03290 [bacterium]|nr:hypothetical protein [bacterium]
MLKLTSILRFKSRFFLLALIAVFLFAGAGLVWQWIAQAKTSALADKLYSPPSPVTVYGAKSGTIGYTPIETALMNIEAIGCDGTCVICESPADKDCIHCGLQHNTAGLFCFYNGFYDRAALHFERALKIEKWYQDSGKPDRTTLNKTTWINPEFRQGEHFMELNNRPIDYLPYSHSARLSGYKNNLALAREAGKHQTKFFRPTYREWFR